MNQPDKDTLLNLYKQNLTDAQVAARFGVNPSTAWRWRKRHGIKLKVQAVYRVTVLEGGT